MTPSTDTARTLDGEAAARVVRARVAEGCARLLAARGVRPGLAVLLVGDHPASEIYVRTKQRAAAAAGIDARLERLPAGASEAAILEVVRRLNAEPTVHGILVQLPLPAAADALRVLTTVDADKDVDGFHPLNAGRLAVGLPGFVPCTPAGILELLRQAGLPLAGRHAVVVGRSNVVGKPMAALLLREDCTITICHSRTPDLAATTSTADILVVAAGRRALIGIRHIKPGAVVVDVGMHRVEDEATCRALFGEEPERLRAVRERGFTLCGDVHPLEARRAAGWLTPVPGGVGPLTVALLLANTLEAAERAGAPR